MIRPLVDDAERSFAQAVTEQALFREYIESELIDQLRNAVMDTGIGMVRPSGQDDALSAFGFHPDQGLFTGRKEIFFIALVFFRRFQHCLFHLCGRDAEFFEKRQEAFCQMTLVV